MSYLRAVRASALAALCLAVAAPAASAETAGIAAGFRNSVGVNLHTDYYGNPGTPGTWGYNAPIATVQQRLADLGIRKVRGSICDVSGACSAAKSAELQDRMVALGGHPSYAKYVLNAGSFTATTPANTPTIRGTNAVTKIQSTLAPYVEALEGVNEPPQSNYGGGYSVVQPAYAADALTTQQAMWAARSTHPTLSNVQVLPSAPAAPSATPSLAGQAPYATKHNAHSYRNTESPDRISDNTDVNRVRSRVDGTPTNFGTCKVGSVIYDTLKSCHDAVYAANRKLWLTETGYRQCPYSWEFFTQQQTGVTEALAAAYLPRQVLDAYRLGIERSYVYELIDMENAGAACTGAYGTTGGRQYAWGLLEGNADLTPKPAYHALRRTLSVIGDMGAGGWGRQLPLAITRNGTALNSGQERHLLLGRIDGSYVLAIWAPDGPRSGAGVPNNHWPPTAGQLPPAVTDNVSIEFGDGPWKIREYRPLTQDAELRTVNSATVTGVDLTWDVKLYDVRRP